MFSKLLVLVGVVGIAGILLLSGCELDSRDQSVQTAAVEISEEVVKENNDKKQNSVEMIQFNNQDKDQMEYFTEQKSFADRYKEWFDRNSDFVGWITIGELSISEAVVRGEDNQEYLRADIDGNYRKAGTVFMDYRNIGNEFDAHMILYGHNLKNDQMFGPLRQYLDGIMEELPIIEYESLYGKEQYQVFSVYRIQADDYQYQLVNDKEYLQNLLDLSQIQVDYQPQAGVKILTLSTCSYEEKNERFVVHASRIEERNE